MAESADKAAESAEKAYAEAAEAKPVAPAPEVETAPAKSAPAPAAQAEAEKPVASAPAPKKAVTASRPALRTSAKRRAPVKKAAAKPIKPAPVKKSKTKRAAAPKAKPAVVNTKPSPSITQLKEKIMATAKTTDFSKPFADAMGDMQTKAKAAYEKSTAYAGEMTDFAKGNVEAMVESGKILSTGMQDMGKSMVEEAKSAYETLTADMKEMASVKSPTELFQLQGKLARRNFDSMVSFSSKAGDSMMKLYTDAFAPISGRVSLAAEKISKAA